MIKKLSVLFFVLFLCSDANSQINLNVEAAVSNLLRYGNGYQYTGSIKNPKEYFENLTDARVKINGVTFGFRNEISDSIEYGVNFVGIAKRFVEYDHESGISLRAGDFWEAISLGMSLNTFEDRALAYDTGIDGVRIGYENTFKFKNPLQLKAQIIGGNINFRDYLDPYRVESYKLRNAFLRVSPLKPLTMGLNYVHSNGILPEEGFLTYVNSDVSEGFLNIEYKSMQFYTSYAFKSSVISPNEIYNASTANGDGLYSAFSYTFGNLGMTMEYKNYRFDITLPDNRSNTRPSRMLPYQNPPTAQKENNSVLTSRNPHVVDFNDEVGGQIDFVYVPNDKLSFNLSGSIASKHYQYTDIDTSSIVSYERVDRGDSWLPDMNNAFSPFWEIYLEAEDYATDKIYGKLALALQNNVLYNQINPSSSEIIKTTTIPLEFRYSFTDIYSLTFINETQWANNSINIGDKNFMNQYNSLTFSSSPSLVLTVTSEFTNNEDEPTGKSSWFTGEISYKLNQSNTFGVSYGSERGGLKCTNGICRFVQPFEGFRVLIATQY
ncbi:MAG: hypothetical protein KBF96_05995 [Ignavibacteria bacterium]|jgi:hypothetical protein|nr:hypothetical protein [Ignavibacteria bacterium]